MLPALLWGIPARITGRIVKNCWGKCDRQTPDYADHNRTTKPRADPVCAAWCSRPCLWLYCSFVLSLHHIIALSPCILPSVAFLPLTLCRDIPRQLKSILGPYNGPLWFGMLVYINRLIYNNKYIIIIFVLSYHISIFMGGHKKRAGE